MIGIFILELISIDVAPIQYAGFLFQMTKKPDKIWTEGESRIMAKDEVRFFNSAGSRMDLAIKTT